jgi:integrase
MASVRKRDPKDPKSPWVVEYTDPATGKRHRLTPKSGMKKDADAARRRVEADIENGEHLASSASVTVKEGFDLFLRHSDQRLKDGEIGRTHYENLRRALCNHVVRHLSARVLSDLRVKDVQQLYDTWSETMNVTTRRTILNKCRSFETFLRMKDLVRAPLFKAFRPRSSPRVSIKTFDVTMIGAVLGALERGPGRNWKRRSFEMLRLAVHLAVFCGLRRGEIFGLTLGSLDFERGVLRIRSSLTTYKELKGPKTTSGVRDVPMPDHVADLLQKWLAMHARSNDLSLVFTSDQHTPINIDTSFRGQWRQLLRAAGIDTGTWKPTARGYDEPRGKSLHFHALRHFASSWHLSKGMSPADVARLLGHSHFDMTLQVYSHPVFDDSHRRAAVRASASDLLAITDEHSARQERDTNAQVIDL